MLIRKMEYCILFTTKVVLLQISMLINTKLFWWNILLPCEWWGRRFLNHSCIDAVLIKRHPGDSPRTTKPTMEYISELYAKEKSVYEQFPWCCFIILDCSVLCLISSCKQTDIWPILLAVNIFFTDMTPHVRLKVLCLLFICRNYWINNMCWYW